MTQKTNHQISSKLALWVWIVAAVVAAAHFRYSKDRFRSTITYDKFGYYLYLPAFFYDDPAKLNQYQYLLDTYQPGGSYQALRAPNGNYVMKYTCGMAIMYLPAFAAGHFVAKILHYPVDGLSLPYQVAMNIYGLLIAIAGLYLLRKILLKYFKEGVVAAVLIIIGFASNYFQYAAYDNLFQHTFLFTLYCIIVLLSIQWHNKPTLSISVLLGLSCGLAALTRPTEIITAAIPLFWGVYDGKSLRKKIMTITSHLSMVISFLISAFAIGGLQLVYWKIYAGSWLYFSYGENQTFSWLHPHVFDVLLSYKKGWLVYTPVMILSVIGVVILFLNNRFFFYPVVLFMLLYFYLVSAWDNWWYGGSFSMRAMIQSYPVLSFAVASFVNWISAKAFLKWLTTGFVLFCIWLNVVYTWQAYYSPQIIMDGESMNAKYYWKVFGKFRIDPDTKKFLDTDEEIPEKLLPKLEAIYFNDLESSDSLSFSIPAHSGTKAILLNDSIQFSPSYVIPADGGNEWYRFEAHVLCPDTEWDVWRQTQMIITLLKDGGEVKSKIIRIYRITEPRVWETVYVDIKGSSKQAYDQVKLQFWNADGQKAVYIDDVQLLHVPY